MSRRVGLLTLPFNTNYGGIIQAAALYHFISGQGYTACLIRKEPMQPLAKRALLAIVRPLLPWLPIDIRQAKSRARHDRFIKREMPFSTARVRSRRDLAKAIQRHKLDAVVVGSDQVWRFEYHHDSGHLRYFLDFVPDDVGKIAYAPSFGRESWTYPEATAVATELIARFDSISVRENSGHEILTSELSRSDAVVVLDPTMIVEQSYYERLLEETQPIIPASSILTYVLDQSPAVQNVQSTVKSALGQQSAIFPVDTNTAHIDLPHWIRCFRDAEYVVTDSFHGTVFSILFRKPFVTIGNHERGIGRFTTLLEHLGLTDRLLLEDDPEEIDDVVRRPIDYQAVSEKLNELREDSRNFLHSALSQVLS